MGGDHPLLEAREHVVAVPDEHRTWITRDEARQVLRCADEELTALAEAGLADGDDRFVRHDVWNVGLHDPSGRSTPYREMVFYNRMLKSEGADWVSPRRYGVTARARCAAGCPASSTWGAPSLPGVRWSSHDAAAGVRRWHGEVVLSGRRGEVRDPDVLAVWDAFLRRYRYHATPPSLARHVELTRERGVGDCEALARVLARDLADAGVDASLGVAYLVGGVGTRWHYLVRVADVDGADRTLDPSMAVLASTFFTPEYGRFCRGSDFNRVLPLADEGGFAVAHDCGSGAAAVPLDVTMRLR